MRTSLRWVIVVAAVIAFLVLLHFAPEIFMQ